MADTAATPPEPRPRVDLNRFCIRCGRYDMRVERPSLEPDLRTERERWRESQRRKAALIRGSATVAPQWRCPHCGGTEWLPAGRA